MHYSALFLCTFSVFYCSILYFFMLHVFHTTPLSCCTFFILLFFHVARFSYCTTFMLHFFLLHSIYMYCTILHNNFTHCNVFVLHSSLVKLFACCNSSCCTLFILQYFQRCSQKPYKYLIWRAFELWLIWRALQLINMESFAIMINMENFATIINMESFSTMINKAVKYCCKALHLRCSRGTGHASTISIVRSSRLEVFLEISQNSQDNTCARVLLLKRRLFYRCFPVNFAKF